MISYRDQNGRKNSKGDRLWNVDVLLEGKIVGEIRHVATGYVYFPKGQRTGGETFDTLALCKKSLEE